MKNEKLSCKNKPIIPRNILFVSPHPDDIELFCGGALLHHDNLGDNITVLLMTKGDKGTRNPWLKGDKLAALRAAEAQQRCQQLKNCHLVFAGFNDQEVTVNEDSIRLILDMLNSLKPDIIYIPEWIHNISIYKHEDHQNAGKLFLEATTLASLATELRYYHSKDSNLFIKMSDLHYQQNNQAMKGYKSQNTLFTSLPTLAMLRHWYNRKRRCWGKANHTRYAEGFRSDRH